MSSSGASRGVTFPIDATLTPLDSTVLAARVTGDVDSRLELTNAGKVQMGGGAVNPDVIVSRAAAGVASIAGDAPNGYVIVGSPTRTMRFGNVNDAFQMGSVTGTDVQILRGGIALLTINASNLAFAEGMHLNIGTSSGSKIGVTNLQKIGFWGATAVVQPAAVADAAGGAVIDAEARAAINALLARLRTIGIIAT